MTTDAESTKNDHRGRKVIYRNAASAPVYGLGFIGALVYFLQHATTFWIGVLGFFKAMLWPAVLVYELLKYLKM
jgi:hypothetical protein